MKVDSCSRHVGVRTRGGSATRTRMANRGEPLSAHDISTCQSAPPASSHSVARGRDGRCDLLRLVGISRSRVRRRRPGLDARRELRLALQIAIHRPSRDPQTARRRRRGPELAHPRAHHRRRHARANAPRAAQRRQIADAVRQSELPAPTHRSLHQQSLHDPVELPKVVRPLRPLQRVQESVVEPRRAGGRTAARAPGCRSAARAARAVARGIAPVALRDPRERCHARPARRAGCSTPLRAARRAAPSDRRRPARSPDARWRGGACAAPTPTPCRSRRGRAFRGWPSRSGRVGSGVRRCTRRSGARTGPTPRCCRRASRG
jgi:hypothetical protein